MIGVVRWMFAAALCLGAPLLSTEAAAKTLVFCSESDPEALNPQLVNATTGMNASRPMFDTLVAFVPGTTDLKPSLAQSWTISPDGTEYVFRLRPGVAFQSTAGFKPTRTMTADDVVFSFERQLKPDHPARAGASFDYFQDMGMPALIRSVERVDDLTVRFRLAHAEAPFLADLAMPFASVLSAEYGAKLLADGTPGRLDTAPLGTGPFVFDSYQPGVALHYHAFEGHWAGRPRIDSLVFSITPNPAVRLTKLKSGECQVMAFPNPVDARAIAADPRLTLLRQEGLNVGYLSLNATKPPFNDARVRRAVNLAVDKDLLVRAVYGPGGTPAKNPIPPTLWSYEDGVQPYPYDPAEAQRLMLAAGLADGFDTEIWYMPVSRPYNPDGKRVAEMIADDLSKIGIRARLVTDEWGRYRARLQAGEAPMALFGWTGDNGDPDNFLDMLLGCRSARPGGNNVAKWCDPAYDKLVVEGKLTADRATRERLYRQAQRIAHDQAPWLPLAHSVVLMAARKEVQGFVVDPLGRHIFETVDLAP